MTLFKQLGVSRSLANLYPVKAHSNFSAWPGKGKTRTSHKSLTAAQVKSLLPFWLWLKNLVLLASCFNSVKWENLPKIWPPMRSIEDFLFTRLEVATSRRCWNGLKVGVGHRLDLFSDGQVIADFVSKREALSPGFPFSFLFSFFFCDDMLKLFSAAHIVAAALKEFNSREGICNALMDFN